MKKIEEFEKETTIPEDYDPDGDRETGYYSRAYIRKYAEWIENKLDIAVEGVEDALNQLWILDQENTIKYKKLKKILSQLKDKTK